MKIEERLRRQLHDTAELVPIRPEDYEQVVRRGRQRRLTSVMGGAAAAVVSVVAVIGVLSFNNPSPGPVGGSTSTTVPPVTTTTVGTVPPTGSISNVVTAGPEGITIHDLVTGDVSTLVSDVYYETISWTVDDGAGGLVFAHEITPLPWAQGSIMWLPAGEKQPRPLLAPGQGELMVPLEMIDGEQTLILRYDTLNGSEIRALDLNTSASYPVVPATDVMIDAAVDDIVVVVVTGGDCNALEFHFVTGGRFEDFSPLEGECLPSINAVGMADGFLYTIEDSANGRELVVRVLATGETVVAIDVGDAWELQVAADGTVAFGGSTITVGRFLEGSFDPLFEARNSSTFSLAGSLNVARASLGSGETGLPCTPMDRPRALAPQDLPTAVEGTRQRLYGMATMCDLEGLAEMALADGTSFTFGASDDPLRSWIRSARLGHDVANWIARILNTEPASTEFGYAWPAVFATNTEEDWEAVSGTLTAEEYRQARAYGSYAFFRVVIDADGRWVAGLAGD
jgi:hypothetical protein